GFGDPADPVAPVVRQSRLRSATARDRHPRVPDQLGSASDPVVGLPCQRAETGSRAQRAGGVASLPPRQQWRRLGSRTRSSTQPLTFSAPRSPMAYPRAQANRSRENSVQSRNMASPLTTTLTLPGPARPAASAHQEYARVVAKMSRKRNWPLAPWRKDA